MKYISYLIRFIKFQLKRLKHLKDSPHEIALGFACGVWTNFNPFFGVNIFIGMRLAFVFRANIIASVIGVLITALPFIFPLTISALLLVENVGRGASNPVKRQTFHFHFPAKHSYQFRVFLPH